MLQRVSNFQLGLLCWTVLLVASELSKLSTVQTYPEYARALLESAPMGFNAAVSEWEKRHGKVQHF